MLVFPFPITDQVNRKWKKPLATALRYLQRLQNDQYSSVINTQCDHKSWTCLARQNRTAETMANENQDKLQSNICAYRCSDFWNGCFSTDRLSTVLYCRARVYSDAFQRNVTASISTDNLAHVYAAITVSQLMCQLQ